MDEHGGGAGDGSRSLLEEPRVASALAEGRQAYVVMATSTGPHVTPELYGWSDGRLWFFAASQTLKAKVLPKRSEVAILVRAGTRVVVAGGESHTLDVADPKALLDSLPQARRAPKATVDFVLRNASDLAGFAVDALRGRTGPGIPPRRVLFGVDARRVALLDGDAVMGSWGDWPGSAEETMSATAEEGNGSGDGAADRKGTTAVVVGWQTDDGLLAFPGRWDAGGSRAIVPGALAALADAPETSRAAVVFDEYNGPGPAAKQGVLLRGPGRLERNGATSVVVDVEREVRWDGVETESS